MPLDYKDKLQFIGHEEGRILFKAENSTLEYDYMIKDHLGNVRMVITEELKKDKYPIASLETAKLSTEDDFYTIDQSKIEDANVVIGLTAYTNDTGLVIILPMFHLKQPTVQNCTRSMEAILSKQDWALP